MKFDLTKEQITFLAYNDQAFLNTLVERILEIGDIPSESVVEAAHRIALKHGERNKIPAIKELREWSRGKQAALSSFGLEYCGPNPLSCLSLVDAKNLIERTYPPKTY